MFSIIGWLITLLHDRQRAGLLKSHLPPFGATAELIFELLYLLREIVPRGWHSPTISS